MMGLRFAGDVPFSDVYVHSVIQAPDGRRMSKSLGTGIDPLDEIDKHGADAVRFGLLAMSSTQDVRYSSEKVEQGQALANKLFNASRFVLLNARRERGRAEPPAPQTRRGPLDPLAAASASSPRRPQRIDEFDFAKAALGLYDFVYGDLCDWYLELVKGREFDADALGDDPARPAANARARAPGDPVRDGGDLASVPGAEGLLAAAPYPQADGARIDPGAERAVADLIAAVTRGARMAQRGRRPARQDDHGAAGRRRLRRHGARSWRASRGSTWRPPRRRRADRGDAAVPGGVIELRAAGPSTPEAEARKREERRSELEGEIARAEGKLGQRGLRRQGAGSGGRAGAREARAPARRAEPRCERTRRTRPRADLDARGGGALAARARAVRHDVRPGADAAADDRARLAAGAASARSTSSARTASRRRRG